MNNLIFIMYERGFVWNTIRSLFAWLDSVAYTLFSWVMQLIFDIAEVSTSDVFNDFYGNIQTKIYALLAIFMLFKVTISMLTYLVNPDSISDKSNGVGKMSIRVVVSLVMLIAFPMAFQFLNTVQPHILNALPRIILSTNGSNNFGSQMESFGKSIAFQTYNGVFFNTNCADSENVGECFDTRYCEVGSDGEPFCTVDNAIQHINDPAVGDSNSYQYTYMPLIGFIVAIVMTLILLGYCVDVAIRVFKLIILQLIAPIPIISYIDPKASKDGAFNKWIKMVISVWADLFIKLGVIYFVILVISELITSGALINLTFELFGGSIFRGALVTLALVIGLLFFAKDAPKFICDAMGIKMAENGKLFGGLGKIMAAGALGAGVLGSAIASGRASYMADEANGKDHNVGRIFKNVGAGLLGGVTGFGAGAAAAVNAKDHNAKAVMDALAKRNATTIAAGSAGSTPLGRALSTGTGLVFGETYASIGKRKIADLEAQKSALETIKSRVSGEMVKQDWTQGFLKDKNGNALMKDTSGNGVMGSINYKDFMARKNAAAARGASTVDIMTSDGIHTISMEDAERFQGLLLKENENDYITRATTEIRDATGTVIFEGDKILASQISEATAIGLTVTNRSSVNSKIDDLSVEIATAKRENTKNEQNDRFSGSNK